MLFLIGFVVLLAFLWGVYLKKCQNFWKIRGVPSTSPNLLLGNMANFILRRKNVSFVFEDIYKAFQNEPVVGFYEFAGKPNLLIRDLKLIETILVKDFSSFSDRLWMAPTTGHKLSKHLFFMRGKQWKTMRTKLITTFSANKLKSMLSLMDRCAEILDLILSEKCADKEVDVKEVISRFATDVMGCCVFGLQFNTLDDPDCQYRKIGKLLFKPSIKSQLVQVLRPVLPKLFNLLKISELSPEVEPFFVDLLRQSEEFRKGHSGRRTDILQLILDVRDQNRQLMNSNPDEIIDDEVVLSNMFIFYLAGFETTAASLSFCLYELALHPEIQDRLREELQTVLKSNNNVITYEVLKKMEYTEMIISETLRKYPPAGLLARTCTSSYQLPIGDTFCNLVPGDRLTIPVHALHHDEKYYQNPSKFEPDRFTPENIAARPSFAYMPFGDGPRICLAARFAKMEMKLCLVRIISKYAFSPCEKTEIPVQIQPEAILLTSKNGIFLRVEKVKA